MAVQLLKGRITLADYYRMAETGILQPDERVELLDGQVVPKMTIGPRHAACVRRLEALLRAAAGSQALVTTQNPIHLDDWAAPEPDVAVLRPADDLYAAAHPGPRDTLLVIEVADTSLERDRDVKLPLYARAGLAEYWIVNLPDQRIEVYRDPSGDGYATTRFAIGGQTVSLLFAPDVPLEVAEVLG